MAALHRTVVPAGAAGAADSAAAPMAMGEVKRGARRKGAAPRQRDQAPRSMTGTPIARAGRLAGEAARWPPVQHRVPSASTDEPREHIPQVVQ